MKRFLLVCLIMCSIQVFSQSSDSIKYTLNDISGIWNADSVFVDELGCFMEFPKDAAFCFGFSDQKASIGGYKYVGMYHLKSSEHQLMYHSLMGNHILIYDRQGNFIYYLLIEKLKKGKMMIATMKSTEEMNSSGSKIYFSFEE